jgi:hypothetical protein
MGKHSESDRIEHSKETDKPIELKSPDQQELLKAVRESREILKQSPSQITGGGDKPFTLEMGDGKVVQSPQRSSKSELHESTETRKDSTTPDAQPSLARGREADPEVNAKAFNVIHKAVQDGVNHQVAGDNVASNLNNKTPENIAAVRQAQSQAELSASLNKGLDDKEKQKDPDQATQDTQRAQVG